MKIRHRITLWVACAGFLTSLVFSLVVFLEMREEPLEILDSQLKADAVQVVRQLGRAGGNADNDQPKILLVSPAHYWIKVYDRGMHPVFQTELSRVVNIPFHGDKGEQGYMISARVPRDRIYINQDDGDEVTFRVRVIAENIAGSPCLVQIAKPIEHLEKEYIDLLTAICIGMVVSTGLLIGLSYLAAGRIVQPIGTINRLARKINENTLDKRIPLGKNHDEIHELAKCLNEMFDGLHFSFARQKQFLADASHELKSPIAILRLFFEEAVLRSDLPENMRQELESQGRNVMRMDRLVRALLELSALEITSSLTIERFDLVALARSVATDFALLMERAGIELDIDMPSRLDIRGDRDRIRRALINIFDNAIKYNEEGGRVQLALAGEKDGARLTLRNTGPGIAKEDLSRVFDQFYRVDKSRSTEYGGAGLGLAIVRQIVRLHHGAVSIDSVPGKWTRAEIFLPRHHGD